VAVKVAVRVWADWAFVHAVGWTSVHGVLAHRVGPSNAAVKLGVTVADETAREAMFKLIDTRLPWSTTSSGSVRMMRATSLSNK
jgi:hypothetical protein